MSGLFSYSSMKGLWNFVYKLYRSFINCVGSLLSEHLHFSEIKVNELRSLFGVDTKKHIDKQLQGVNEQFKIMYLLY